MQARFDLHLNGRVAARLAASVRSFPKQRSAAFAQMKGLHIKVDTPLLSEELRTLQRQLLRHGGGLQAITYEISTGIASSDHCSEVAALLDRALPERVSLRGLTLYDEVARPWMAAVKELHFRGPKDAPALRFFTAAVSMTFDAGMVFGRPMPQGVRLENMQYLCACEHFVPYILPHLPNLQHLQVILGRARQDLTGDKVPGEVPHGLGNITLPSNSTLQCRQAWQGLAESVGAEIKLSEEMGPLVVNRMLK